MATTELGGGVLRGTVVTRDGWPVPHAVVTVLDVTGAQSARTTVAHDDHFSVAGLCPGNYTVITAAAGMTRRPCRPGQRRRPGRPGPASTQLDRNQYCMIWNQSLLAGVFAVGRTLRITIDVEAVYQQ
jgi:hypothetical protein